MKTKPLAKNENFRPLNKNEREFITRITKRNPARLALDFPPDLSAGPQVDIAVKYDSETDPKFTTVILRRRLNNTTLLFVGTAKRNTQNQTRVFRRLVNGKLIKERVVKKTADPFDRERGIEIAITRAITTKHIDMP